ncbi:hypothetical protein QBC37DRAFT_445593 [Rhypophila decipiens]|uniref:Uncharacterized protein n=1 Tax=Rhypophila decipiens TaxID=261697 RepID=A0AAN7BEF2_9PEZI|nr:hypothetical protein QBC37DRAFT_445593 [Rhypophila decipiens]
MATFSPEYHALAAEGRACAPGLPGVVAATSSSLNQLGHWGEYRFVELKDADEAVADDVGSIYESYVLVGGKAIICTSIHKEYDRYNQTERMVEEIFRARRVQSLPTVDVCVGSDDFFALLATQNGKSVARMLGSYPSIFGRRMVSRIRLFPRFDGPKVLLGEKTFPDLCWFVDHIAPVAPGRAPKKNR